MGNSLSPLSFPPHYITFWIATDIGQLGSSFHYLSDTASCSQQLFLVFSIHYRWWHFCLSSNLSPLWRLNGKTTPSCNTWSSWPPFPNVKNQKLRTDKTTDPVCHCLVAEYKIGLVITLLSKLICHVRHQRSACGDVFKAVGRNQGLRSELNVLHTLKRHKKERGRNYDFMKWTYIWNRYSVLAMVCTSNSSRFWVWLLASFWIHWVQDFTVTAFPKGNKIHKYEYTNSC